MRKAMVKKGDPQLSVRRQCELLGVNRNRLDREPPKAEAEDLRAMRIIDEIHLEYPSFGARQLARVLQRDHAFTGGRERVARLMRLMGVRAVWPGRCTSRPGKGHAKHPYLLRGLDISRPDQVWCSDLTYIPMGRGFCYLAVVMDWHTRYVLGWALSVALDAELVLEAYRMAVRVAGRTPEIMNTDQGCQYTCGKWAEALGPGVRISMDGKGRWVDNVMVERLWWSLKHENVYLMAYGSPAEAERGIGRWLASYNTYRPHSSLSGRTPAQAYGDRVGEAAA